MLKHYWKGELKSYASLVTYTIMIKKKEKEKKKHSTTIPTVNMKEFGTFLHRETYLNTQGNWQMELYLRQLEKNIFDSMFFG